MIKINTLKKLNDCTRMINNYVSNKYKLNLKALVKKELKNNDYFKSYISKLDNCSNDCNIEVNEIRGLDYSLEFDFNEISIPLLKTHEIKDIIIDVIENDYCFNYNSSNNSFSISTSDEIFISDKEGEVYFSDREYKSFSNELDLFIKTELYMNESGYYPSIVDVGYYDEFCGFHNFSKEYDFLKTQQKDDEKKLINILKQLDTLFEVSSKGDTISLTEIDLIYNVMPELIKNVNNAYEQTRYLDLKIDSITLHENFDLNIKLFIDYDKIRLNKDKVENLLSDYNAVCYVSSYGIQFIEMEYNIKEYLQKELNV